MVLHIQKLSTFSHIISARLYVEAAADDDCVSFALKFQLGDTGNDNPDFLLFTWNAQPERAGLKLFNLKSAVPRCTLNLNNSI